ncbi:MAG: hypothetical protein WCS97_01070 [Candidatus Paceibacterota bacterium]|jgi:ribulose-phosphate 3-epimerase
MSLVVPAVLPSSQKDLEEKLSLFSRIPSINRVQIDVVDGRFATPASWPFFAEATKGKSSELDVMAQKGEMLPRLHDLAYEIDLMCLDAEHAAAAWLALGATRLTFHAESTTDLPRLFSYAERQYGSVVSFGLALNITSDLAIIEPCLEQISYVQFMGIAQIGRQGQPFDRRVLEKVRVFHSRHPEIPLQVDGGISLENARELIALGVTNLIIGSALARAKDPVAIVEAFEELQSPYGV